MHPTFFSQISKVILYWGIYALLTLSVSIEPVLLGPCFSWSLTQFITSTPGKSNTALAIAHEEDKIMQTFPNPTCLTSSSIFPERFQTLQLSQSSFFHDLITSLMFIVLNIPKIQLHSHKILQNFCSLYFSFHNYLDICLLSTSLLLKFFPYIFLCTFSFVL